MPKDFNFRGRNPMDKRLAAENTKPSDEFRHAKKDDGTTMCGLAPDAEPLEVGALGMCLGCLTEIFKKQVTEK